MNDLIKIENKNGIETVNARELHEFLESKQDFSTWVKGRIKKYDFSANIDFICFHKKMEANNATIIDYHISLDMAKELSMVENNEKGREARRYFIECEKKAKGFVTQNINSSDVIIQLLQQNQIIMKSLIERVDKVESNSFIVSSGKKQKYKLPPAKQMEFQSIGEDYYTIAAYQKIRKISLYDTSSHGKILTGICNREGIQISSVKSTTFGIVNSYPESVLKKYFDSMVVGK